MPQPRCVSILTPFHADGPTSVLYVFVCSLTGQSLFRVECQFVEPLCFLISELIVVSASAKFQPFPVG